MKDKDLILFTDPYSKVGAHPNFNQIFINAKKGDKSQSIFGFFKSKSRFFLLINCLIIFFRILSKKSFTKIYFLAWPNKLLFLLNILHKLKDVEIALVLHNNIERIKNNMVKKVSFNLIVLDSGLLVEAYKYFKSPEISLFPHPLPLNIVDSSKNKRNELSQSLIIYAFGEINLKKFDVIKFFLNKSEYKLSSRGFLDSSFLPMKRFHKSEDYFAALKSNFGLIVLPCVKYRSSASGFILDCLSQDLNIFLPHDFPLKFDILNDNNLRENIFYFDNEDDLFFLLKK